MRRSWISSVAAMVAFSAEDQNGILKLCGINSTVSGCWVRVPLPPPPPYRPLALGACDCSGGPLSSVSPSAGSRSELALRGFSSPPSSCWILALCCVAPWPSSAGAGPALACTPTNASDATLSYSRRGCMPFSVVVAAASVEFSGGCPAPPAPSAVSITASGVSVSPCRAAPSPPWGGCDLVARVVGGFSSPPPRPRPSSPRWYQDAVRAPRVSSPLVLPPSLGFQSSCDNSNPPPFSF